MKFKKWLKEFWDQDTDTVLYRLICIFTIPALALMGWYVWATLNIIPEEIAGCVMLRATGFYCPGCGGTRSVVALLRGNLIQSVLYHPAVLYGVVLFLAYFVSQTLMRLTKGRVKGLPMKPYYLYILLGIIAVNFIVRNVLLVFWGIATL